MLSKTIVNEVSSLLWHGAEGGRARNGFLRKACISQLCPLVVLGGLTFTNLQCLITAQSRTLEPRLWVSSLSDRKVLERPRSHEHTVRSCLPGYKGHDLSCHQLLEPNSPWLQRMLYVCVRNCGKVRARLLHTTKIWIHRFILEQGLCNKTKWNNIKAGNWNALQYYWRKYTNSLIGKWHTN